MRVAAHVLLRLERRVEREHPVDAALEAQEYMRRNAHLGKIVLTV